MSGLHRAALSLLMIFVITFSDVTFSESKQAVLIRSKSLSLDSMVSERKVKAVVHYQGGGIATEKYLRERAEEVAKRHMAPLNQALEGFSIPQFIQKSLVQSLRANQLPVDVAYSSFFDRKTLTQNGSAPSLRPGETRLKIYTQFLISEDYSQIELSSGITLVRGGKGDDTDILLKNVYYYESDTIDSEKRQESMALFKEKKQAEDWYESEKEKINAIKIKSRRHKALKKLNNSYRKKRKIFDRRRLMYGPRPEFVSIWADKAGETFKERLEKGIREITRLFLLDMALKSSEEDIKPELKIQKLSSTLERIERTQDRALLRKTRGDRQGKLCSLPIWQKERCP